MDYIINKFGIVSDELTLDVIYEVGTVIADYTVEFILADGVTIIQEADMTLDPVDTDHCIYKYPLSNNDGVFTAVLIYQAEPPTEILMGNLSKGNSCMLTKVLKEEYDCLLFQQLEATKHFIMLGNGPLARDIYTKVLQKCARCVESEYSMMGVSVEIESGTYIIK